MRVYMGSSRGDAAQRQEPKCCIFTVTAYRCLNIYKYKYIYTLFSHYRCFEIDLYWWGFLRADIYWRIYWICRFNPLYCPLYLIKCVNCSHPIFFVVLKTEIFVSLSDFCQTAHVNDLTVPNWCHMKAAGIYFYSSLPLYADDVTSSFRVSRI